MEVRFAKLDLGLYDSANGKNVKAYKIVDATNLCSNSKKCVIKYANVIRGTIAQICDWYESKKDLGVCLHYHINEMTPDELINDDVFKIRCSLIGADPNMLAQFIFNNQYLKIE